MGQQQLLLIVLGVIIVGIAVVVGINVFTASASSANRDAITADLTNLSAMAQQFYRKPVALGGGGNVFTGWTVPANLSQTANMSAAVTPTVAAQTVTLVAVGTETGTNGTSNTKVTVVVTPTGITTTINN
jgi:Tfp pilus assembly protein PilE